MTDSRPRAGASTASGPSTPRSASSTGSATVMVAAGATAIFTVGAEELVISPMATSVAADLGTTVPVVGMSVSVYGGLTLVGAAMVGILGAHVPRRALLLAAMAAFCLGTIACALAPDVCGFMIGRGAAGLAAGIVVPTLYGLVGDTVAYAQRAQAMSMIVSAWSLSLVLGVPAGGLLSNGLGWRWTFSALALLGLVATCVIALSTPTGLTTATGPTTAGNDDTGAGPSGSDGRPAVTVLYLVTTLLNMTAFYGLYTYLGAALQDDHAHTDWAPEAAVIAYGLGFATCAVTGRFLDHRTYSTVLPVTLSLISLTIFVIGPAAHAMAGLAAVLFIWGVGQGLTVTLLSTLRSQGTFQRRGAVLAFYTVGTNLGVILGAAAGGTIYAHAGLPVLALCAAGLTLGAALTSSAARYIAR